MNVDFLKGALYYERTNIAYFASTQSLIQLLIPAKAIQNNWDKFAFSWGVFSHKNKEQDTTNVIEIQDLELSNNFC